MIPTEMMGYLTTISETMRPSTAAKSMFVVGSGFGTIGLPQALINPAVSGLERNTATVWKMCRVRFIGPSANCVQVLECSLED